MRGDEGGRRKMRVKERDASLGMEEAENGLKPKGAGLYGYLKGALL